jgi:hypothetical protein
MTKKNSKDQFVQVPLWWIKAATTAMRTPKALVAIELLHSTWRNHTTTEVPLSNSRLAKLVHRFHRLDQLRRIHPVHVAYTLTF